MVALKHAGASPAGRLPARKQERRGGIETGVDNGPLALREVKQERRGGIETKKGRSTKAMAPGSRNAVVALKPGGGGARPGCEPAKQERRGGIETAVAAMRRWSIGGKQERRGGIETASLGHVCSDCDQKQERRGGIETYPIPHLPFQVLLKQERRGGIETRKGGRAHEQRRTEAGTPWWH